jgi:hypothetical protein
MDLNFYWDLLRTFENIITLRFLRFSQRRWWELETHWKWRQFAPAKGRAMAQAVSHWPFLAKAQAKFQAIPCGVYGGQSDSGNFSSSTSVFPCQCHNASHLYSYFIYLRSTVQNLDQSAASLSKAVPKRREQFSNRNIFIFQDSNRL